MTPHQKLLWVFPESRELIFPTPGFLHTISVHVFNIFFCKSQLNKIPPYLGRTRTSRTGGEARRRPSSVRWYLEPASLPSCPPQIRNISPLSTPSVASMKCFPICKMKEDELG